LVTLAPKFDEHPKNSKALVESPGGPSLAVPARMGRITWTRSNSTLLLFGAALAGCLSPRVVSLDASRVLPELTGKAAPLLDVVSENTSGTDPLPVAGSSFEFQYVSSALGGFIGAAVRDWAERHRAQRVGGWQVFVELTRSRADVSDGRLTVELDARITLRGAIGLVYLAQTPGHCKEALPFDPKNASVPAYQCMERMAKDIAGWVEAVSP
jgi:hypothetical protein